MNQDLPNSDITPLTPSSLNEFPPESNDAKKPPTAITSTTIPAVRTRFFFFSSSAKKAQNKAPKK